LIASTLPWGLFCGRCFYEAGFLVVSPGCIHSGQYAIVGLKWLDFANSEQLRENILRGLDFAREYRVKVWLADNSLLRAIRPKDFEWMGPAIITLLNQLGVQRIAVVESQDAINRMGVSTFLSATLPGTSITTRDFATVAEARAWCGSPL